MPLGKVRPNVTPKVHPAYPDTGAEQSMVSEDLLETLGLTLETSTKAVEAVDGGRVTCLGSSPVELEYQGRTAQTRLLVTDALRSEVILSKTVLEKLEVIDQDFPNARARGELKARDDKRYPNPDPGWGCNRTPKGYHTSGLLPEDHASGSLPEDHTTGSSPRDCQSGSSPERIMS